MTSSGTIWIETNVSHTKYYKVVSLEYDKINFTGGYSLESYHDQDCCESHELYFSDLCLKDFERMEFDLENDCFFNRITGYGIELIPLRGHTIKIAGHGYNNGYYSSELTLILKKDGNEIKRYDISDCQEIKD